jgi:hypothetical protein
MHEIPRLLAFRTWFTNYASLSFRSYILPFSSPLVIRRLNSLPWLKEAVDEFAWSFDSLRPFQEYLSSLFWSLLNLTRFGQPVFAGEHSTTLASELGLGLSTWRRALTLMQLECVLIEPQNFHGTCHNSRWRLYVPRQIKTQMISSLHFRLLLPLIHPIPEVGQYLHNTRACQHSLEPDIGRAAEPAG